MKPHEAKTLMIAILCGIAGACFGAWQGSGFAGVFAAIALLGLWRDA